MLITIGTFEARGTKVSTSDPYVDCADITVGVVEVPKAAPAIAM